MQHVSKCLYSLYACLLMVTTTTTTTTTALQFFNWSSFLQLPFLAAWHSGNVVARINEVTLCRARLVLGWVTIFGVQTTLVFHQATQANSASYPQRDGK